ncbi:hypothetical protein SAMN05660909_05134 [Chitinophaga terrae (ex Kim and Jung 2007)]|uniref:Uncharacterized protein n=2 Tax=Chitinophaga terrae (ex Kim and Jung 2007) TaxID=408074 RepID=A0A1H4GBC6_9BACT|nr:hypothetical protein SAMN05660909_05134 [Chitinophaga terrae (ex Kim and Jung 2007)]
MWVNSDKKIESYFKDSIIPAFTVKDKCVIPRCTGELLIQKKVPVPWAWASLSQEVIMPSKIVKLHVQAISEKK